LAVERSELRDMTTKYFSGSVPVKDIFPLETQRFLAIGGKPSKGTYYDGFRRKVGHPVSGPDAILPVTRTIFFKSNPSLHKCDARCRNAKGTNCECACGGEFHGVDA
jgi:hypothetical protein